MIRAKMENDELQKKKDTIFRIREEKHKASMINRSRNEYKHERLRQMSLVESKILQNLKDEKKSQTIEVKRNTAEKVREQKSRLRDRLRRYEVTVIRLSNSKWIKANETIIAK